MYDEKTNFEEGTIDFDSLIGGNSLNTETDDTPEVTTETVEVENEKPTVEVDEEVATEVEENTDGDDNDVATNDKTKEKEGTQPSQPSAYRSLAKKYLESGKWHDGLIETEEGEIKLSELEDIDEDTFFEIQEQQEKAQQEESLQNYISKEGLNDTALKLIELQKNGGDMSEAFRVYEEFVHPFKDLDFEDERVQEAVVRDQLTRQGLDKDVIDTVVEKHKKNLTLDKEAEKVKTFVDQGFEKYMADQNKAAREKKEQEVESHREYMKGLKSTYENLDLKPALKNKFLKAAQKNDKGEFEVMDVIREKLQNPETASEVLYYILEPEAFKKSIGAKTKVDENLKNMKRFSLIKDKEKKQVQDKKKEEPEQQFEFFDLKK